MYIYLTTGPVLRYDTLLLDSTPILPKPAAYTRFARALIYRHIYIFIYI